jgi:hypothetical protein
MSNGAEGEVVLGLEMMEEATFGDPGFVADVIDRSRGIPLGTDDTECGIEQPVT